MRLPDADAPMCASGKRPFRTEDQAAAELRRAQKVRGAGNTGYRPGYVEQAAYECPACKWWHLSSATGPQRRNKLGKSKGRRR